MVHFLTDSLCSLGYYSAETVKMVSHGMKKLLFGDEELLWCRDGKDGVLWPRDIVMRRWQRLCAMAY